MSCFFDIKNFITGIKNKYLKCIRYDSKIKKKRRKEIWQLLLYLELMV